MPSEGSRRADLILRGRRRGDATPGSSASPVPASRRPDLAGAGRSEPAPNSPSSPVRRSRRRLLAEAELAPVDPETVQDGRQLARQRDRRPPHAPALRDLQRPALEGRNVPALVSMTFAASYKAVRTIASPALLMPPVTSVS